MSPYLLGSTVMFPSIVWPLTLHTSPSDYATFIQIKSVLIFNIKLLLEREKQQKVFALSIQERAWLDFGKNWQMLLKTF